MTAIIVIKFQAGPKLDIESHKALFWDVYFIFYIYIYMYMIIQDKK